MDSSKIAVNAIMATAECIYRFNALMRDAERTFSQHFTQGDMNALRNLCKGYAFHTPPKRDEVLELLCDKVPYDVEDRELSRSSMRIVARIDSTYGCDIRTCIRNLSQLSLAEQYALIEDVEAFWAVPDDEFVEQGES